jgi:hypothetical protein
VGCWALWAGEDGCWVWSFGPELDLRKRLLLLRRDLNIPHHAAIRPGVSSARRADFPVLGEADGAEGEEVRELA